MGTRVVGGRGVIEIVVSVSLSVGKLSDLAPRCVDRQEMKDGCASEARARGLSGIPLQSQSMEAKLTMQGTKAAIPAASRRWGSE
jgi:hypothetical protein